MTFLNPTLILPCVTDITTDWLRAHQIKGLLFDLDNTLIRPKTAVIDPPIEAWLKMIQAEGFLCAVVSNNKKHAYLKTCEDLLRFPVYGFARKPSTAVFKQALATLALKPEHAVVIGDRPLTDIWGGIRLKSKTILVDPLNKDREPWGIQRLRQLERCSIGEPLERGCP
jgi:uncharacterized protein